MSSPMLELASREGYRGKGEYVCEQLYIGWGELLLFSHESKKALTVSQQRQSFNQAGDVQMAI
ncbi:hypothetical protein ACIPT4_10420 [Pectobacterium jejuense]|uniref:hypothetical protein n=1 Tax=Pectobacterium TaxID=122277 RepID=UPI001CC67927|nr:hypothetical protein [Pectobacterium polaris]UAY91173.1 hypothetical protein KSL88_16930 [Pectobacterium polaris]